jgi:hypothetical protein
MLHMLHISYSFSPHPLLSCSPSTLTCVFFYSFTFFFCRFHPSTFNHHTSLTPFSHLTASILPYLPFPFLPYSHFPGTDLGGLFKDFLTDLSARVFDPSYGLFLVTSDNLLYPNPSAILLYPEPGELEALYSFLGTHRINIILTLELPSYQESHKCVRNSYFFPFLESFSSYPTITVSPTLAIYGNLFIFQNSFTNSFLTVIMNRASAR